MKTRRISKEELETHLWYDPIDNIWKAFTNIRSDYNRFKKRGWKVKNECFAENGQFLSAEFEARRGAIKIANAEKRVFTEEQKIALRERMQKMHEARQSNKKNIDDELIELLDDDDEIDISTEL